MSGNDIHRPEVVDADLADYFGSIPYTDAKRHRAVSTCIAAGRLITLTVISLSYALVVGIHRNGIAPSAAPA